MGQIAHQGGLPSEDGHHASANPARCRVTLLIRPTPLQLCCAANSAYTMSEEGQNQAVTACHITQISNMNASLPLSQTSHRQRSREVQSPQTRCCQTENFPDVSARLHITHIHTIDILPVLPQCNMGCICVCLRVTLVHLYKRLNGSSWNDGCKQASK